MNYKLYELINPIDNQVFYIGITCQKYLSARLKDHCCFKQWKLSPKKMTVIKSIKQKGLKPKINCLFDNLTKEEAEQLEIDLIDKMKILGYPLTNIAEGGNLISLEQRQKMSIAALNRPKRVLSQQHKDRIALANLGRKQSQETKEKISASKTGKPIKLIKSRKGRKISVEKRKYGKDHPMFGKKHSDETKEKMRKAKLKNDLSD